MKIAAVDMDDTLVDYIGAFTKVYGNALGFDPLDILTKRDTPEFKARHKLITSKPNWWLNLQITYLGVCIIEELKERDYQIVVVTKGPDDRPQAWTEKQMWFNKNLSKEADLIICTNKRFVKADILIDDWPPYFLPWLENNPNKKILCPDLLHNRNFSHPNVHKIDSNNLGSILDSL